MKSILRGFLVSVTVGAASHAAALSVPLSEYNLVVEHDYTHAGGSVYGTALIGGDILGNSPAEFASRVDRDLTIDSLTVLGDINNSVHVQAGSVVLGGSVGDNLHVNINNASGSLRSANASDHSNFDDVITDLKDASDYYASLSSNTSYTGSDNNWGFSYSGDSDIAVFSGSVEDIFLSNAQIRFDDIEADTLILNITDAVINIGNNGWNLPGFDKDGVNGIGASNILWNFYQAETVQLGASNFMGSILAMSADVTLNSTLDGAIGAKSLYTNRQIHDYNFKTPLNPVPIPGSLLLFGSALMVFGTLRRRSKKA